MKKLILSLSVLTISGAFAQKNMRILRTEDLNKTAPKTSNLVQSDEKSMTTLWSDDFSDATTWVIDNSGQTAVGFGWNINNTRQGWWSSNPTGMSTNGTSGGNNAELSNGNAVNGTQALNVVYTLTTKDSINISNLGGTNNVSLQFKQFGARFNDLQEVQISTNGIDFVTVANNLDKSVLSSTGGSAYPNPETKLINLATYLSSNPTAVWIRYRWTTNYPSSATNPNVWVAYGWYIDDVKILSNPENDLKIISNYWGTEGLNYYQIPVTQVAPIAVESSVFNGGISNQPEAFLKAEILAGTTSVFSDSSAYTNINSLDTVALTVASAFTPPASVASYKLKRKLVLGYLPDGQVLTGNLSNSGSGYNASANNVQTSGGTGSGLSLNITTEPNGGVLTLNNASLLSGSGYTTSTNASTTSNGNGSGLTLDFTADVVGAVDTLANTVLTEGSGYITANNLTTTSTGLGTGLKVDITADTIGKVTSLNSASLVAGTGYVDSLNVSTSGGSGLGLTVDLVRDQASLDSAILSVTINKTGSGYTIGDTIHINAGNNDATIKVLTVTEGKVLTVAINQAGSGYAVNDTINISGVNNDASIKVVGVKDGAILSVSIKNAGSGYNVGDTINISGGNNDAIIKVSTVSDGSILSATLSNPGSGYTAGDVVSIFGGSASYTISTVSNNTEITDEIPSDNTIADVTFGVTNFIYARDNGVFAGSTSNGTDGFEVGNFYDIFQDQTLYAINVRLLGGASGTTAGTEVYARLYSVDNTTGDFVYEGESNPLAVASNNLNTNLVLPLQAPINLLANTTYLAMVGSPTGGMKVSNAGTSTKSTSFFLDGNDIVNSTLYYETSTPVVRLNFDPSIGIKELPSQISGIAVYPNPTSNVTNVHFDLLNASEVSYEVRDLSGKVILNNKLGTLNSGKNSFSFNVSNFDSGLYFVTINSNNTIQTKKFSKN